MIRPRLTLPLCLSGALLLACQGDQNGPSEPDRGLELTAGGLCKNEAFTNVTVKDGESFAIAGLINNEVRQSVGKVPLLGDLPILGALFRSTRFQNNETELLFLVTVKLIKTPPAGSAAAPDPTKLMELREDERKEFTLAPGVPGVGEVVNRPFGKSNLAK